MNFRTGDILVWRGTGFHDILSDVTIGIKGLHTGMILKGEKFSTISVCGKSPSDVYVTFLIDKVFPIEEVVGHVWVRHNGAALYHINRIDGPEIDEDLAMNIIHDINKMNKLPFQYTVGISIIAYFRCGYIAEPTGYDNNKWQLCSIFNEYLLSKFGLLKEEDFTFNNTLPIDFYNLDFYQKYNYQRITLFDKETHTFQSWFNGFFINFGMINVKPLRNEIVDYIMGDYDYPRHK